MPYRKHVFLPPLFERLTLDGGDMLDEDGVKQSVAQEISLILNTRTAMKKEEDAGPYADTYPPFFGFGDNTRRLFDDRSALKRSIAKTIERYEPRLQEPEVISLEYDQNKNACLILLKGFLMLGNKRVPATFLIKIADQS